MKVVDSFNLPKERIVKCPNGGFISHRILLESDKMGYSLTRTVVPKNGKQFWHYKNHLETCYCVSGLGILTNTLTNEIYYITSGKAYVLDLHDPHTFEAIDDEVELICVFNPPLKGNEIHKKDGSY
jgi:L-ectoine synthase